MNMLSLRPVLSDYCNIFASHPSWRRKERHVLFQAWLGRDYELPSYEELLSFLDWVESQQSVAVNDAFHRKVLYPVFDREICEARNPLAMKRLLLRHAPAAFAAWKNAHDINLLAMALELMPEDRELLALRWESQLWYYQFTIHEVPWGVLAGNHGASAEEIQEHLQGLGEFEALSKRLGKDTGILVQACRDCYSAWELYITHLQDYESFDDCLKLNRYMLAPSTIRYVWGEKVADPWAELK